MILIFPLILFGIILGIASSIYYSTRSKDPYNDLRPHADWKAAHRNEFFVNSQKILEPPYFPKIEKE